jgi:hypothetical protein
VVELGVDIIAESINNGINRFAVIIISFINKFSDLIIKLTKRGKK